MYCLSEGVLASVRRFIIGMYVLRVVRVLFANQNPMAPGITSYILPMFADFIVVHLLSWVEADFISEML